MKIALCFSGQPRFINECFSFISKNVIGNNDVDVFGHLWFDTDLQTNPYKYGGDGNWVHQRINDKAIEDFKNLYNPKKLIVEESKKFNDFELISNLDISVKKYWPGFIDNPKEPNYQNRVINNCLSYFYSLNEVCKIKKLYEYENNFKYDVVIRCRTDSIVKTKLDYKKYDMSFLNYSSINNQPDGMVCDWFNFSSSINMDAFMSVFSVSSLIFKKCMNENNNAWCHELLHRKILDVFNIPIKGHDILIELPRF